MEDNNNNTEFSEKEEEYDLDVVEVDEADEVETVEEEFIIEPEEEDEINLENASSVENNNDQEPQLFVPDVVVESTAATAKKSTKTTTTTTTTIPAAAATVLLAPQSSSTTTVTTAALVNGSEKVQQQQQQQQNSVPNDSVEATKTDPTSTNTNNIMEEDTTDTIEDLSPCNKNRNIREFTRLMLGITCIALFVTSTNCTGIATITSGIAVIIMKNGTLVSTKNLRWGFLSILSFVLSLILYCLHYTIIIIPKTHNDSQEVLLSEDMEAKLIAQGVLLNYMKKIQLLWSCIVAFILFVTYSTKGQNSNRRSSYDKKKIVESTKID